MKQKNKKQSGVKYNVVAIATNRNKKFKIEYYLVNEKYIDLLTDCCWVQNYDVLSNPNAMENLIEENLTELQEKKLNLKITESRFEDALVQLFNMKKIQLVDLFNKGIELNNVDCSQLYEIYLSQYYDENDVEILYEYDNECDDESILSPPIKYIPNIQETIIDETSELYIVQSMYDIDEEAHVIFNVFTSLNEAYTYLNFVKQGELGEYNFLSNSFDMYCTENDIVFGETLSLQELMKLENNITLLPEQVYLGRDWY